MQYNVILLNIDTIVLLKVWYYSCVIHLCQPIRCLNVITNIITVVQIHGLIRFD